MYIKNKTKCKFDYAKFNSKCNKKYIPKKFKANTVPVAGGSLSIPIKYISKYNLYK